MAGDAPPARLTIRGSANSESKSPGLRPGDREAGLRQFHWKAITMPTPSVGIVLALIAYIGALAFGAIAPVQADEQVSTVQEWQKKGLLAALSDPSTKVLKSAIGFFADDERVAILRAVGESPMNQAPRIAGLLKDEDSDVRRAASGACQ